MKRWIGLVGTILLLTLVVGCGTTSSTLVEYRRTGGIAGFDDRLTVYSNGDSVLTRKGKEFRFTLSKESLASLSRAFATAVFSRLESEYRPSQPGADLMQYEITLEGKTVRATDGALPFSLLELINVLNVLVSAHSTP